VRLYTLNAQGEPIPDPDGSCNWLTSTERAVRQERIAGHYVSTVFLGVDHNHSLKGPPVLWETMIQGPDGKWLDYRTRCPGSREQAVAMHKEAVDWLLATLGLAKRLKE
jgi:hypothetical protein